MKYAVYVMLAGCLWGTVSVFINLLDTAGFTSMQCVALRSVLTAVILFVYLLITDRKKLLIQVRHIPCFIGMGILSVVFFNFCYFRCISLMGGAAVPALLLYTAPVIVMILSALCFKEKITRRKVIAIILALAGLSVVTGAFTGGETVSAAAVLYGLGAAFGYALYSIFGKFVVGKYDPVAIIFYTFLVASAASLPISGLTGSLSLLQDPSVLLPLAGLVLICTVAPYLFYTKGLSGIEAGKASVLATVEPVAAAIVGIAFFHESITISKVLGMILVLASVISLNIGTQKN